MELIVHELLLAQGFSLVRPQSASAGQKTPDFFVQANGRHPAFAVEATTLNDTREVVNLDRAGEHLRDQINTSDLPRGFYLHLKLRKRGPSLSKSRVGQEVATDLTP